MRSFILCQVLIKYAEPDSCYRASFWDMNKVLSSLSTMLFTT